MDSISRGHLASELLDNPLLQETLKDIESAITEQWKNTKEHLVREELWFTLKGLDRFKMILESTVENG